MYTVINPIRNFVQRYPSLYIPYARWRSRSLVYARAADKGAEIVIDGIARSANSFAWAAFQLAQNRPVQIAHHIHRPGQIICGVRLNLPVVLLIREPDDVVLSRELYGDGPSGVENLFKDYIWFYKVLLPFRHSVVVADFPTVTDDFNKIIQTVNTQFGTEFLPFAHTEENVRRCFDMVDSTWGQGAQMSCERRRRVPSGARKDLKQSIRHKIEKPRHRDLRRQAKSLYCEFLAS